MRVLKDKLVYKINSKTNNKTKTECIFKATSMKDALQQFNDAKENDVFIDNGDTIYFSPEEVDEYSLSGDEQIFDSIEDYCDTIKEENFYSKEVDEMKLNEDLFSDFTDGVSAILKPTVEVPTEEIHSMEVLQGIEQSLMNLKTQIVNVLQELTNSDSKTIAIIKSVLKSTEENIGKLQSANEVYSDIEAVEEGRKIGDELLNMNESLEDTTEELDDSNGIDMDYINKVNESFDYILSEDYDPNKKTAKEQEQQEMDSLDDIFRLLQE